MVDKLIGALAQSIEKALDGEYIIYTEDVHQNAEKPCIFVRCESAERVQMLNRHFFVRVNVKLTVEPGSDEKNARTEALVAKLFNVLGMVEAGGVCFNGRKIHGKWAEGSFVVGCIYDMWQEKIKECDLMEKIEVKGIGHGGAVYEE
ncbi:MAG: hypothetical protein IJ435_00685 [Clostridia bacterium]|nr:hypothetical protein [Clostridia bacterium]